jgi:hypothetical protein
MKTAEMQRSVVDGLTVAVHGGEPMVLDVELAQRLEYSRPRVVRELIERLRKDGILCDCDICRTVRQNGERGRPAQETGFNGSAALDVVLSKPHADGARHLYRQVKVFMACPRGTLVSARRHHPCDRST